MSAWLLHPIHLFSKTNISKSKSPQLLPLFYCAWSSQLTKKHPQQKEHISYFLSPFFASFRQLKANLMLHKKGCHGFLPPYHHSTKLMITETVLWLSFQFLCSYSTKDMKSRLFHLHGPSQGGLHFAQVSNSHSLEQSEIFPPSLLMRNLGWKRSTTSCSANAFSICMSFPILQCWALGNLKLLPTELFHIRHLGKKIYFSCS